VHAPAVRAQPLSDITSHELVQACSGTLCDLVSARWPYEGSTRPLQLLHLLLSGRRRLLLLLLLLLPLLLLLLPLLLLLLLLLLHAPTLYGLEGCRKRVMLATTSSRDASLKASVLSRPCVERKQTNNKQRGLVSQAHTSHQRLDGLGGCRDGVMQETLSKQPQKGGLHLEPFNCISVPYGHEGG